MFLPDDSATYGLNPWIEPDSGCHSNTSEWWQQGEIKSLILLADNSTGGPCLQHTTAQWWHSDVQANEGWHKMSRRLHHHFLKRFAGLAVLVSPERSSNHLYSWGLTLKNLHDKEETSDSGHFRNRVNQSYEDCREGVLSYLPNSGTDYQPTRAVLVVGRKAPILTGNGSRKVQSSKQSFSTAFPFRCLWVSLSSLNKEYNPTRKKTRHVILYSAVGAGGLDLTPGNIHGNRDHRF